VIDQRRLIAFLWTVIFSLLIGGAIAGYLIITKTNDLMQANQELGAANDQLRSELQAQQSASPTPSPSPSASPTPSPTVSPAP
jgi:outer membrane murein-binding lipoprotein Lpp